MQMLQISLYQQIVHLRLLFLFVLDARFFFHSLSFVFLHFSSYYECIEAFWLLCQHSWLYFLPVSSLQFYHIPHHIDKPLDLRLMQQPFSSLPVFFIPPERPADVTEVDLAADCNFFFIQSVEVSSSLLLLLSSPNTDAFLASFLAENWADGFCLDFGNIKPYCLLSFELIFSLQIYVLLITFQLFKFLQFSCSLKQFENLNSKILLLQVWFSILLNLFVF